MKKTLIALAAFAATGAAMAQSSVTIYGVIDVGYTSVNNSGTGTDNSGLSPSNMTTSRLGFRGTEDLGGGLKANFQVESSLNADAPPGATPTTLGDRGAWVGLSGDFGSVRLGREYSTTFWSGFLYSPFGTGGVGNGYGFANRVAAYNVTGHANPIWNNNAITYTTPRVAGFMGEVQYAFDESATNNSGRSAGLRVNYSQGPLAAEIGYSKTDGGGTPSVATVAAFPNAVAQTALTTTADHKSLVGGVSYDFGVAKVMANYGQEKASNAATGAAIGKVTNYEIGLVAPLGPGRIRAAYDNTKFDLASSATDAKVSKFALGYIYDLSKRTALYATVASQKNKNGARLALSSTNPANSAETNGRSTGYNIGISHTF